MSDTPGADSGALIGWSAVALGVGLAVTLTGDGQAVGCIIATVGLGIVAFAGATNPLERAVMESAGTGRGLWGLVGLCVLVVVGVLLIVGSGALAGGVVQP